ncbi:hypothetical protein EJ04DRAFT_557036 [Polyplosphaeria fusca]|uniref:DUF3533 domain-containing protein n=1 Tax=Polyplosphaeria fusca TaxID=682080 RepID=A0A9P4UWN8_9PLEO|nr:hypothetical protein EJ04DRAFT_557036 [Polyplosphaeria fusca]
MEEHAPSKSEHNVTATGTESNSSQTVPPTIPPPHLYAHSFFSTTARPIRRSLLSGLVVPVFLNGLLMWACLALFFGSLLKTNDVRKIGVSVVNLDDGFVGEGVVEGVRGSLNGAGPHLRWRFGGGDAREIVVDEKDWAVVEVSADASANLMEALQQGNETYNPLSAVTLFFASARNQVLTGSVAIPAIMGTVNPILAQIAANSTATYLASIANDTSALTRALRCPQCLSSPLAIQSVDLIPFNNPQAFGLLNTGCIFLLTFTFNVFIILRGTAETYGHILSLPSHLAFRTLASSTSYLFLSLTYTLIILAFSVPLTAHFSSRGAGFMVLWMLNWFTMGACGLVMEAVDTVIGMQWAPFFLNVWLIVNASAGFGAFEMMVGFYEYGWATPFVHCIQASRTIVFGTKSHLGLNFGVLAAWIVGGLVGVYGVTWWKVREGLRKGRHMVS